MNTQFRRGAWLFLVLGAVVARSGRAQVTADSLRDSTTAAGPRAPVVLLFDTLFYLHSRLGPFSPEQRAATASARLAQFRGAIASGRDTLRVEEVEGHSEIIAGDQVLMTVLDADAKPTGKPRAEVAQTYVAAIRAAAFAAAKSTGLRALAVDTLFAVATTAALLLLLRLLVFVFRRLYAFLAGPRIPALRIQKLELLSGRRLGEALTVLARVIRAILTILVFYFYVPLVLSFFPGTAPYSRRIVGYIVTPLESVWTGFLAYLPKVFFIVVIVLVTRYILKLVRLIFLAMASGALTFRNFHRDWAIPTYNIVRFLIIAFAVVVMFPYLPGAGSDAFKGVSLFVGVLFSLGSSGAVGNIIAGVVLTYTRAFQIGDRVKIGETVGDVMQRTLLVTRVRTIKNVEVTIPNGTVLGSQVINYTSQAADRGLILHTTVTIGYDAPWKQVHELLIAAAKATPEVLADPAPFVLQTSLDDFYVTYEINAYTNDASVMARTYSALHQNIQDRFNEGGVEIMSPHYGAFRDGNQVTIPAPNLPADYQAPAFRFTRVGGSTRE
ncbi:MAG: mechanosensitive ion channel family protein [Gemmatimonadota bacterium]